MSQIYNPLDKDIVREAWVVGNLKEQLGIRHRYRKNDEINTVESTALFEDQSQTSAHETGISDYIPVDQTPPTSRTPPNDGPMTHRPFEGLLDVVSEPTAPVSPISPAYSYYSVSALPASATLNSSPRSPSPPNFSPRPLPPPAVVHESRSRPSLSSDGGEFEMHVRSTGTPPSAPRPRTPDESRSGLRERQESYMRSGASPSRTPNPYRQSVVDEEDGSVWSGAVAI